MRTHVGSLGGYVSILGCSIFFSPSFSYGCRGGHHRSDADDRSHFLVHGFGDNGHAYASIHAYSPNESALFDNGGRFREGGDTIDLEIECRPLANV